MRVVTATVEGVEEGVTYHSLSLSHKLLAHCSNILPVILRTRALVPQIAHINASNQNSFGLNVDILLFEFGGSQEVHNRCSTSIVIRV